MNAREKLERLEQVKTEYKAYLEQLEELRAKGWEYRARIRKLEREYNAMERK